MKEEAKVTPRKRANSMSFGFKKLTDDQVKHLNQVYNVREGIVEIHNGKFQRYFSIIALRDCKTVEDFIRSVH